MCLSPLNIRVKNKYFTPNISTLIRADVPCGHCTECQFRKRDEYKFRLYYEFQRTLQNGGFVLSQALTYRERSVPRLRDFFPNLPKSLGKQYCFNRVHIRQFFMELRNTLRRQYHCDPSNKLKYFLAAEYGTDEKGTHRPHYHLLIFWSDSSLNWALLSHLIEKCWHHGISDGVDFKGAAYLNNDYKRHVFFPHHKDDFKTNELAIEYVTEYLIKDTVFYTEIKDRIAACEASLTREGLTEDEVKKEISSFKRYCCQFHLNSPHVGDNFMDFNDMDEIMNTGHVNMPSSNKLQPTISIPMPVYFQRKLFYQLIKDFDDNIKWVITELGQTYKYNHFQVVKKSFKQKFEDLYKFTMTDAERQMHDLYLSNRQIDDFIDYMLLYRGRLVLPTLLTPEEQILNITTPFTGNCDLDLYFGAWPKFKVPHEQWYYDQESDDKFRSFDDLFDLFASVKLAGDNMKERTNLFTQQLKKSIRSTYAKT